MVVVVCCYCIFGGVSGALMSMYADSGLLRVLVLLHLFKGDAATECSSCSICCMIAARFMGKESAVCCATIGLLEFALVKFSNVGS